MLTGFGGFAVLLVGIGLITDGSVRMRGGVTRAPSRRGGTFEMLCGIVVGLVGFAMVISSIAGGPPGA